MRAVDPAVPRTATRHTLTQRVAVLRPGATDLIDAGFVAALTIVAMLNLITTFNSLSFLLVALVAVLLGIVCAHLASALGWPWLAGLALAGVVYFVFGGVAALRPDTIGGVVPSVKTLTGLAGLAITGWKGLLTTLPPIAGDSQFLVLVWFLGLLAGVVGYGVARATRSPGWVLLAPAGLFAVVTLLGGTKPSALLVSGLGFAAFAVGWVIVRTDRRRHLIGTGAARASTVVAGTGLVVAALVAGALLGPILPGVGGARTVLRDYVQPPIDVSQYPSPLPGLVKFSSESRKQYFDVQLASVTGAPAGSRLRLAVLDQYTGLGWSASGTAVFGAGFRRVGSVLPVNATGQPTDVTVTVSPEFAGLVELRNWVPSLGPSSAITFQGSNARTHLDALAYDEDKGQVLVTDGLQGGDAVDLTTYPVPELAAGAKPTPAGTVMVSGSASDFMNEALNPLMGQGAAPWDRLMNIGHAFTQGFWSDGSKPGEGYYLPGNGQGRLQTFMDGQQFIGSDEQYAAAFALAANRLGFPARVVFGANIESDGAVYGKDVIAWVEVNTTAGWQIVPPAEYIPSRSRTPEQVPPDQQQDNQATQVPPPNPVDPPGNLSDLAAQANAGHGQNQHNGSSALTLWLRVGAYAGGAILAIALVVGALVAVKAMRAGRRRQRGTPGQQIAGGWRELIDRARDTGAKVTPGPLTHLEQANSLNLAPISYMVAPTDRAMFGPADPDAASVAVYWQQVDAAKTALIADKSRVRRLATLVNPRSLLPMVPATAPSRHSAPVTGTTIESAPAQPPAVMAAQATMRRPDFQAPESGIRP